MLRIEEVDTPRERRFVFFTDLVTEPETWVEELLQDSVPQGAGGPPGWVPLELRLGARFGVADTQAWTYSTEMDPKIHEIVMQARSKAAGCRIERFASMRDFDRVVIEIRPHE